MTVSIAPHPPLGDGHPGFTAEFSPRVEYLDHMGSDLSIVNAARVSHAKRSTMEFTYDETPKLREKDIRLLDHLARGRTTAQHEEFVKNLIRNVQERALFSMESAMDAVDEALIEYGNTHQHFAPFAHAFLSLRVTAPLFVARQLWKSHVGFAPVLDDIAIGWSEESRRYVSDEPILFPMQYRAAASDVKQGSAPDNVDPPLFQTPTLMDEETGQEVGHVSLTTDEHDDMVAYWYEAAIAAGVAPESARAELPQKTLVQWVWTGSLLAFHRVCSLREQSGAQEETRYIAGLIASECACRFPHAWTALASRGL